MDTPQRELGARSLREDDGSHESYQLIFGKIDNDNSKSIDFKELCAFFGYSEHGELLDAAPSDSGMSDLSSLRERKEGERGDRERGGKGAASPVGGSYASLGEASQS